MKKILFILLVVFTAAISSCYYDKEELLYHSANNAPCTDTAGAVSYAQKVAPMLQQHCYSCHTGSFPSGNVAMGTYTADKIIAQNGSLYGSISHAAGYSPMPKGMSKMSNCQLAVIKKWIDAGMQNN
ncbi:hypothetical protein [Terrimonas alba]|uniref:hypothetical protein n=1 Tax=Terrimonas alba TaxID=3349636 RepID=UPI0035F31145